MHVLHMVYSMFTLSESSGTGEVFFSSTRAAPLTLYVWSGPAQEHQLSDAGPGLAHFFLSCSRRGRIASIDRFYPAPENEESSTGVHRRPACLVNMTTYY